MVPFCISIKSTRLALVLLLLLCGAGSRADAAPDTARFLALLNLGDSIYSKKQSINSFQQSLPYFDSAQVIAEKSGSPRMLAFATFARGRVYDGWNKEPARTIALYTEATRLFKEAGDERGYFYAKHLIAHAYDKIHDSLGATSVLRELVGELSVKDTAFRRMHRFMSEMALIATEVRAYPLADSILRLLTRRSWIENDPDTYNYLDHYYLTQSRLDIYWRAKRTSSYPDSLAATYAHLTTRFDQLYYATELANLYAYTGDFKQGYYYRDIQAGLAAVINSGRDFEQMQRALVASETAAQRRKLEYEAVINRSRTVTVWVLSLLLIVITVLSIYLFRRTRKYQDQSVKLQDTNRELDAQVDKVEVLNKEIQHRIKNNLYTIYSLLHMQQDSTDNEEVIAHLEAARLRIESVASLHDHLLAGSDIVDFSAYLKVLINKVVSCFADRRRVVTHIAAAPVSLPVNTCFALSLILNEWITNSIKYAVTGGEVLQMDVRISNKHGQVCIDYADDGQLPDGPTGADGLGTEIIRLLTAQVKGKLLTVNGHPYHYNLCIPNGQPA